MVLDCLFGSHLRLYLLTFLKELCIICVIIHDKKHLKGEGVYFASQRSMWMLSALQSQQGTTEMLVLCSPFSFDSVQAPSAFRGSSFLGLF